MTTGSLRARFLAYIPTAHTSCAVPVTTSTVHTPKTRTPTRKCSTGWLVNLPPRRKWYRRQSSTGRRTRTSASFHWAVATQPSSKPSIACETRVSSLTTCASGHFHSTSRSGSSWIRIPPCSWSSRIGTRSCDRCWRSRPACRAMQWYRCSITAACRSPRVSSSRPSQTTWRRCSRDFHYQAAGSASRAAQEYARLHGARLRGSDVDAVRRLRPRLRDGRTGSGMLGAGAATAPRGQDERHRLLVQDYGLLHETIARLQQRAWADALGDFGRKRRES